MVSIILLLAASVLAHAAPRKVLYVTHSAGFVHGSIPTSIRAMQSLSPDLEVTATEDLSFITASRLKDFDAIFFFTSGELPLAADQKADLLAFVRGGKGFGGAHSATDTLYSWPEYGELIGGVFDGHPWAQEVVIEVEEPLHPAVQHLAPAFKISDEIYQFRSWSRDNLRVLMKLDTRSVNLQAQGVNRTDGDFALAWVRYSGAGRVFYTALGHGDETWLDPRIQTMLRQALFWLCGDFPAPAIAAGGVVDAITYAAEIAPGGYVSVFGSNLTTGLTEAAASPAQRLAGTSVLLNGKPVELLYVSPGQVNARLPAETTSGEMVIESVMGRSQAVSLKIAAR